MQKWYINKELTELRKSKNWSVAEFCIKAGIDETTYYQLQQGKHLKSDTLKALAVALNLGYGMDEDGAYLYQDVAQTAEKKEEIIQFSTEERELIRFYRALNWEDRSIINQLIRRLAK